MNYEFIDDSDFQVLGIPYCEGVGYGAGYRNIGFIDLLNEPDRIDEIPEIRRYAKLRELIKHLNSKSESGFLTLRTDSGIDFFPEAGFEHTAFIFFTIAVRRLHPTDDRIVFDLLNEKFHEFLQTQSKPRFSKILLRISKLEVPSHDYVGCCLDFFTHGFGFSVVAAERELLKAFDILDSFLRGFTADLISNKFDELFVK